MEARHKRILTENLCRICDDLEPSLIFASLIEKRILTFDDKETINTKETRSARAMALVDVLFKRGPHAYHSFLNSLNPSHQQLFLHLRRLEERTEENPSAVLTEGLLNAVYHVDYTHVLLHFLLFDILSGTYDNILL